MHFKVLPPLGALAVLTACSSPQTHSSSAAPNLAAFQARAAKFNAVVSLPRFETTPEAVRAATESAIAQANRALDDIGALRHSAVTLRNTIGALDDVQHYVGLVANRMAVLKETSPQTPLRDVATEAEKQLRDWAVGVEYREDVYAAVKAFAATQPRLTGEAARLLDETLRDYRRAGLALPKATRDEVERLRKELAKLCTDFSANVTKAKLPVKFTRAELDGVPEDFLNQPGLQTGPDEYTLLANVTLQHLMVQDNAKSEAARRRMLVARYSLAQQENVPLMNRIVELRADIARRLGYASWTDYQTEVKMAKNYATAREFLEKFRVGLQPKFDAELREYAALKAKETGEANPQIHLWDARYYANQLKKQKYTVDTEALRVYFPYEKVLAGMFRVYETIFGLKIEETTPPYKWVEDLKLFLVSDARTGEPLGAFYLDMFPREGKYNHFAEFGLIDGKRLPDGKYQRPVASLICNFPAPTKDRPSLLAHNEVETLFHEFGHAMHYVLTRAQFVRYAGTGVPGDFVEAPSHMLENWVWDKRVLDTFAADYRDPSKKIPAETIAAMRAAKLATIGDHYRRQLSFGLLDLALHGPPPAGEPVDCVKITNPVLSGVYLPVPEGTAFIAYFGHMVDGYDGGYYGYAWADAIAADMATVFEKAPGGFLDPQVGRRLREEVYAVGGSRDVNESIQKFLGRERSLEPFLKKLGIGNN